MKRVLWPWQLGWCDFARDKQASLFYGEMGVGKTGACIESIREIDRVLILCPIAVGAAWAKQFQLWDPTRVVVQCCDGSSAQKAKAVSLAAGRFAVVVNYDAFWRKPLLLSLERAGFGAIVLDESHRIKSPSGKASKEAARLAQKLPEAKRICLTGTPTPHSPLDWWAQFRFLDPTVLGGAFFRFRSRIAQTHPKFPSMILRYYPEAMQALSARIDPFVYKIKSDDVLTLPDAVHIEIPVKLSPQVRRYYKSLETDLIAKLESGEVITAANKLVLVTRLQQATSGIATDENGDVVQVDGEPDKIKALLDWSRDLPPGEPLVVFCKFTSDIKHVIASLTSSGIPCSELSGSVKQLEQWQNGETQCIVVQQQTGSAGIDLTRACIAVYLSTSHSLGDYEQSLARIRRPGQSRTCKYVHLVAQTSVDEDIYGALSRKRDVVEAVLSKLTRRVVAA